MLHRRHTEPTGPLPYGVNFDDAGNVRLGEFTLPPKGSVIAVIGPHAEAFAERLFDVLSGPFRVTLVRPGATMEPFVPHDPNGIVVYVATLWMEFAERAFKQATHVVFAIKDGKHLQGFMVCGGISNAPNLMTLPNPRTRESEQ